MFAANAMNDLTEENRFVMRPTNVEFPKLETTATDQIALTIWYSYLSRLKSCRPAEEMADYYDDDRPFLNSFGLYATYEEDLNSLIETLCLAACMKKKVKNQLEKVREELRSLTRILKNILNRNGNHHSITRFNANWCVWQPNCTIDYKKTATKMVSSSDGMLTEVQKFAIMSLFCLVEQIEAFELESLGDFIEEVQFLSNPELYYWIRYKKNELDTITPLVPNFVSLDAVMASSKITCERISVHRVQYFYQRLGADDQVAVVKKLLVRNPFVDAAYHEWLVTEPLISKMTLEQQRHLLSIPHVAERIIIYSAKYSLLPECASWTWRHLKTTIPARTFTSILKTLTREPLVPESTIRFAIELWDTASDNQRSDILRDDNGENSFPVKIIKFLNLNATMYELLNRYLASKSREYSRTFLSQNNDKMAIRTDDPQLLRFIWYSFGCTPRFISILTMSDEMKARFGELWCRGEIDLLDTNLDFYFSDNPEGIIPYKAELIEMMQDTKNWDKNIDTMVIADSNVWMKFCQSIDPILPDSVASSIVKQHFVLRYFQLCLIDESLRKGFDHVKKVVEELFADEELNNIKKLFLFKHTQPPSKYWLDPEICDVEYFHDALEWCCSDNQEDVLRFKEWCTSPDHIFDLCFFQIGKEYSSKLEISKLILERLNKYLKWHLPTEDEIKNFKKQKFDNRDEMKIFSAVSNDERSFNILLEWFFDDDAALVHEFKAKKMRRE